VLSFPFYLFSTVRYKKIKGYGNGKDGTTDLWNIRNGLNIVSNKGINVNSLSPLDPLS
jgi:hypothetical protein